MTDVMAMMDFAMQPSLSTTLIIMPLSGFVHPAALPALMIAWSFGAIGKSLFLSMVEKKWMCA